MLAALLLTVPAGSQAHPLDSEPRFSSVVLTEGVSGGIIGPITRRQIEVGYDWEIGVYRVTVFEGGRGSLGEEYRTGVVTREWFEDLLEEVLDRGLNQLTPQTDPDGADVYGLDTRVTLFHGERFWTNAVHGGCDQRAVFEPTPAERQAFADVVRVISDRAATAAVELGCILDSGFVVQLNGKQEGRVLLAALEHALRSPLGRAVDRRQIELRRRGEDYEVRFRWRNSRDLNWLMKDAYTVGVHDASLATRSDSHETPPPPTEDDLSRRRAYIEANPDLPSPFRRLIAEGWIWPGMTEEMITAALGVPEERGEQQSHFGGLSYDDEGRLIRRWPPGSSWPQYQRADWPRAGRPVSRLER